MPNLTEQLKEFIDQLPEELRPTASDLLSEPEKLRNYLEAHTRANEEAKTFRHALKSLQAASGIDLTPAEMAEVSERVSEIFADGGFNSNVYAQIVEDYGGLEMVESGEIDPEELGLFIDPETNELVVDMDDGELLIDDDGYYTNKNGYYTDEAGNIVEEPVEAEPSGVNSALQSEIEQLRQEKEQILAEKEQIALKQKLMRYGADPQTIDTFAKIYADPTPEDGGEVTDETLKSHFDSLKQNRAYSGFFAQPEQPAVRTDHSRLGGSANTTAYEEARQKGDIERMLSENKKFIAPSKFGGQER